MGNSELKELIFITMLVFMIMPLFLLAYAFVYNKRKKTHLQEKVQMKQQFEQETLKTQQEVREQTMQTIGADLHDNIGQLLSLTALTLKSIPKQVAPKTKDKVTTSIELLSKAITEMRQLGKLLQGDQLLIMGLDKAIQQEVDWLSRSGSYQIHYTKTQLSNIRNPDIDLFYFRILQEILNNIIKHAQARHIRIALHQNGSQLELIVNDDGIGFSAIDSENHGSGLANIKKRAAIVGGDVQINSQPGKGTQITIKTTYP